MFDLLSFLKMHLIFYCFYF